jgi:hypothetical protein
LIFFTFSDAADHEEFESAVGFFISLLEFAIFQFPIYTNLRTFWSKFPSRLFYCEDNSGTNDRMSPKIYTNIYYMINYQCTKFHRFCFSASGIINLQKLHKVHFFKKFKFIPKLIINAIFHQLNNFLAYLVEKQFLYRMTLELF